MYELGSPESEPVGCREVVSCLSFIYVKYDPVKVFCPNLSNLNAVTFGGKRLWLIC